MFGRGKHQPGRNAAKEAGMGRSFVTTEHEGQRGDPTANEAGNRVDRELARKQREAEEAAEWNNYVPPQSRR